VIRLSLLIHLRDAVNRNDAQEIHERVDLPGLAKISKDILAVSPIQADLLVKPSAQVVNVSGRCACELELACSRCLTHFYKTLEFPFHEAFSFNPEIVGADREDSIHLVTEDKVDLTPYIEEHVLLELPLVPLCSEDCRGLCPVCGQNKNERDCSCQAEQIDPRLAGLKDFFKSS